MINEEDHLRLQVIQSGLELKESLRLLDTLDSELQKDFEYARNPRWGYLTACPTNVGTGMRASVMIHLPALVMTKRIGKVLESVAETVTGLFKQQLSSNLLTMIGGLLSMPAFRSLKRKVDYAEHGGAPLLGIDGICIVGHGRSSSKAIKNGIRVAAEAVLHDINQHIIDSIKDNHV